jgi:predicted metalloprotease with PDZ domain
MKKLLLTCCLFALAGRAFSQLTYQLSYPDSSKKLLYIKIIFKTPVADPFRFIMPRFIPGNYEGKNYERYVGGLEAVATDSSVVTMREDLNGPRWYSNRKNKKPVAFIRYTVDIDRMEKEEPTSTDASVIRPGYAGLLNYSIFGFVQGFETQPLILKISTFDSWPIFSTIAPKADPQKGSYEFNCSSYYQLADGQTLMGPALRLKQYKGLVPIFIADYSEGNPDYLDDIGWEAVTSLSILNDYFKTVPFANYTVVKQHVKPQPGREEDANAMEHLNSCTLPSDLRNIHSKPMDSAQRFTEIFGILHHMGHAYIPLRCYGDQYKPYVTEFPAFIKTIWFNEGFIWFLCGDAMKDKGWVSFYESDMQYEPMELKQMGLFDLSQLASLQYGDDFRIGVAIASRGANMASEINTYLLAKTDGQKSMKDVFQYLYQWAQTAKRPFAVDEFPKLVMQATGVNIGTIYEKWQLPLNDAVFSAGQSKGGQ